MSSRRIGGILATAFVAICVIAWIDGGHEPLHPIEQEITVPGVAQ